MKRLFHHGAKLLEILEIVDIGQTTMTSKPWTIEHHDGIIYKSSLNTL